MWNGKCLGLSRAFLCTKESGFHDGNVLMIESFRVVPVSWALWMVSARRIVRRLGVALFALLLAYLTSVVHVSHTCFEDPVGSNPAGPDSAEPGVRPSCREEPSATPCLACMFLKAIRSTLASGIVFIPFWTDFFQWLRPIREVFCPLKCALSGFRIRAPPSHRSLAMMSSEF